jgi:hypothetical protein
MKGRIITALAIVLLLVFAMSLPAAAAVTEENVNASVTVDGYISITINTANIAFGSLEPGTIEEGANGQYDGSPAVTITVQGETNVNVDIGIKGTITSGTSFALSNWLYSKGYDKVGITGLTDSYVKVYDGAVADSVNAFYHWITIPEGTTHGTHSITISYKAVETGTSF